MRSATAYLINRHGSAVVPATHTDALVSRSGLNDFHTKRRAWLINPTDLIWHSIFLLPKIKPLMNNGWSRASTLLTNGRKEKYRRVKYPHDSNLNFIVFVQENLSNKMLFLRTKKNEYIH